MPAESPDPRLRSATGGGPVLGLSTARPRPGGEGSSRSGPPVLGLSTAGSRRAVQAGAGPSPAPEPPHRRRRPGVAPEINVTPLVDVVLVLLIIFMVIAPQLEQGLRIELPGVRHPDPKVKGALDPITLIATVDGQLLLDKQPLREPELVPRLQAIRQREPERRLVLKGDRAIPYARARLLFKRAQEAGFPGVAMMVGDKARASD